MVLSFIDYLAFMSEANPALNPSTMITVGSAFYRVIHCPAGTLLQQAIKCCLRAFGLKLDGVAPLMTDPPPISSTTLQK